MNPNRDKKQPQPSMVMDELALQNAIRKRYCRDWPDTILQLTKRVQAVSSIWAKIMMQIMTIPGLSIRYTKEEDKLIVAVSIKQDSGPVPVEEVEIHEITVEEMQEAHQYVEVLIMDKIDRSELIARWVEDEAKRGELP